MELTDKLIQGTVVSIMGYIVAQVAKSTDQDTAEVMGKFLRSETYRLLADKETGMYWDSVGSAMGMFLEEMNWV